MFYDRYVGLCDKKNVSPSKAAIDCGFNKGSVSVWKKKFENGEDVKPTPDILMKIANYFDVSIDYLLGNEEKELPPDDSDEILMFALYGGDNKDITPGMLEDVRKFAQFIRDKEKEKGGGK